MAQLPGNPPPGAMCDYPGLAHWVIERGVGEGGNTGVMGEELDDGNKCNVIFILQPKTKSD